MKSRSSFVGCASFSLALAMLSLGVARADVTPFSPPSAAATLARNTPYLWDALDAENAVLVRGCFGLLATVVLLLALIPAVFEARLTPAWIRSCALSAWLLPSSYSAWLSGKAYTGGYAGAIRAHAVSSYLALACVLGLSTFGVWWSWKRLRASVVLGVLLGIALALCAVLLFWAGGVASAGDSVLDPTTEWVRLHGSAKGFACIAALLFTTASCRVWLFLRAQGPRLFETAIVVGGVFSVALWINIGHFHFDAYVNLGEQYSAFLGAKYPELGVTRLYQCSAVADAQDGLAPRVAARAIRRIESDFALGTTAEILAHPARCTDHFSDPERWRQFRSDNRFFRTHVSAERWDELQTGAGYHETPVWAILGRAIANSVELSERSVVMLASIDVVYLLALWIAARWAFGWRAAAVAAVYWGLCFPARFTWEGGAFLRFDGLFWMVIGLCCLRRQKHVLAGAALTYAALLRLFPGLVLAALLLKAIAGMVRERRVFVKRELRALALGCAVALVVLVPLSGWVSGFEAWGERARVATVLDNAMGLPVVLDAAARATDAATPPANAGLRERLLIYLPIVALFCVLLARAGDREADDWVAACLAPGLIAIVGVWPSYDYACLLTYGLLWEPRRLSGTLATALATFTCFAHVIWTSNHAQLAAMSLATAIVAVVVTARSARARRASEPQAAAAPTSLPPSAAAMPSVIARQALATLDFRDPAYQADPYPTLTELRSRAAFASAELGMFGVAFVALRYQAAQACLTDQRLSINPRNLAVAPNPDGWWVPRAAQLMTTSMLNMDDPDHRRLRRLVHKAFAPATIKHIEHSVDEIALELIDACANERVIDIMSEFAVPMPLTVISRLIGVPPHDQGRFKRLLLKMVDGSFDTPLGALRLLPHTMRMTAFLDELVALRRRRRDESLVSTLLAAEDDGDRLDTDEIVAMLLLLLVAGFETSAHMIGNGLLALLDHPEQLRLLTGDATLMDCAVNELLRYDSPVHFPIMRTALEDMELDGMLLRKGETVLALLGSANRDESVFADAHRLDITRSPNRHLGFGMGIHFCLGAHLARMEAKVAFTRLLERFPNLRLGVPRGQLRWQMSLGFRGLRGLPVITA